jgi:hypothetical protein
MTETVFQQTKEVMKKASQWRSRIKLAESHIEKHKILEMNAKNHHNHLQAGAARTNINYWEKRLQKAIAEFSVIQLPN